MKNEKDSEKLLQLEKYFKKSIKLALHNENLTKGQWKKPPKLLECIEKCLL